MKAIVEIPGVFDRGGLVAHIDVYITYFDKIKRAAEQLAKKELSNERGR